MDLRDVIRDVLGQLNRHFDARARHRPQPVRSLLMDDCVDRGRDFNDGGARYNWSAVNVAGLANVADSLAALRKVVLGERAVTPRDLRDILEGNFEGHETLRQRLAAAAKFGNDDTGVDARAAEVAGFVYGQIRGFPCARGGRFLPSHIMFETYARAGHAVGATPDGRRAGEPLADSTGAVQGMDRQGPTAMLQSLARLPQRLALGTPVLNMRMQLQLSVLDRAELEDALIHPERHGNLIVRIGGYSTHFNVLTPELKREVIKRTQYSL
jgi:formate C-acetyltransferase